MPLPAESIVLSFDPGGTTGYCAVQVAHDLPAGFSVLESGLIRWDMRIEAVAALIHTYKPIVTVVESFKLYKGKADDQIGSDFPSVRVIGIIEAWLWHEQLTPPIYQSASLISGSPPVQILEEHLPLLYRGTAQDMEHPRDAYKHARYYISRARRVYAS